MNRREQLMAEIRKRDSGYDEAILDSWRGLLSIGHDSKYNRAILDRRALLEAYDEQRAENERLTREVGVHERYIATLHAENERLRAKVAAVSALLPRWEDQIDEHTRAKYFGIAEGFRVALQDTRAALASGDEVHDV